jgi:hypothetical protein
MVSPRLGHTATLLADGRVLMIGGARARDQILASAEIFDPRTGTFAATGSLATARYKHGAAPLADGRVLVAGGSDARDWAGKLASAEIYDPRSGTFAATGSLQSARFKLSREAFTPLPNGRVLVAGGSPSLEVFSGGRFSVVGQLEAARYYTTVTLLADGGVLLVGGYDDQLRATAQAYIYRE